MEELYKLKKMLQDELEKYGRKGELTGGSLAPIDTLAHALKSITTYIAMEEADDDSYSNTGYYDNGNSYERRNSNAMRRNSRGRYSRDDYSRDGYSGAVDGMVNDLRKLMDEAPNEELRREIKNLMTKVERM